jgi:hypothetical protein
MRSLGLLLILSLLASNGCSILIARCGKDVGEITTRDKAREEFGEPSATGRSFDEFNTRRKIYDPAEYSGTMMAVGMSLGLADLVLFPYEALELGSGTILGRKLRFDYDEAGRIINVSLDGRSCGFCRDAPSPSAPASEGTNDRR